MGGVTGHPNPPRDGEGDRRPKAGGGGGREPTLRRPAVYAARKLRRTMSLPEVLLWQRLRGSPEGVAVRKQHPIDPYVADFHCSRARLVIEIDGEAHERADRPRRDEVRAAFLHERGYHVLRIAAGEVPRDPDNVAASIVTYAADPLHHRAARGGPPPRSGEDLQ